MVNQIRTAFFVILLIPATNLTAMKQEDFKIAIHNEYGAQIQVQYTLNGNLLTETISPNAHDILGVAHKMSGEIKIYRAGAVVGFLAAGFSIPITALEQMWPQKRTGQTDTLLLIVKSQPGKLVVNYVPTLENSLKIKKKLAGTDVLDHFPDLKKYNLDKTLTPDRIRAIQSYKEIVVPAGWIARATTGEDIARYILSLPPDYNADSVKKRYTALALEWHPDKQPTEGLRDIAQQLMPLITHARDLLQEALRDKGQL